MYSGTGVDYDHVGVVLQCLETVEKPLQLEGRNVCQFFYSGSAADDFYAAGGNGYDLFKFLIAGQNVSEIVIAVGGGGIPVIREEDRSLRGIEAVIDKDLASEILATGIGASMFVNLTNVDGVYENFKAKTS